MWNVLANVILVLEFQNISSISKIRVLLKHFEQMLSD